MDSTDKKSLEILKQASILSIQWKNNEAIALVDQAIKINTDALLNSMIIKWGILTQSRKYEEAIELYDVVLSMDDNCYMAWKGKWIVMISLLKEKEALLCFNKALKINPNDETTLKWKKTIENNL